MLNCKNTEELIDRKLSRALTATPEKLHQRGGISHHDVQQRSIKIET